jgi:hypothetical protein
MTAPVELVEPVRSRTLTRPSRPALVGELLVIVALLVVYDRVRSLAGVRSVDALSHGWGILHLETAMHLGIEDTMNTWLTGHGRIGLGAVDYYQFMHVTVAVTVLAGCYLLRPAVYRRARNALVLTNVVGLVVFALYPVAPPRLLPGAGFVDSVALAGFGTEHGPIPSDQYGAMPSLHLAWATWAALTVFAMTRHWAPRLLLVGHVALTAVVVEATANHYLLDVVSGMLLGSLAIVVAGLAWPGALRTLVPLDLASQAAARVRAAVGLGSAAPAAYHLLAEPEPAEQQPGA